MKTCFNHNSALSARTQPSFCTFDVLILLYPKKHQFLNKPNEKLNFRASKKIGRAAAIRTTTESLTKASNLKELSSHTLKMLIAPQLSAINADPAELLHVSSTHRGWDLIKFSRQKVLITKSYDRDKLALFSVKENDRKFRDFRPIIFRQILSMPTLQNLDVFMKKTISASVGENSVIFFDLTRRSLKLIFRQKFIKIHQILMRNAAINFFHIIFGKPQNTHQIAKNG